MHKPEILAPAGSPDALRAAVLCGADAVYLGVQTLNARRSAENFTEDSLESAVRFCHARGVKVHLTLNTLIGDNELQDAHRILALACAAGVDALIVQDLAAAKLAKACAPQMPLHASTQMSVQTEAGLRVLQSLGFCRAVLPRELEQNEIAALCQASPIETEVFVHGALCMCVSGQCLLSAMLGERSGNRGACAQPCRLPFSAGKPGRSDLSLKDLSLTAHLNTLAELGVASFKIEGRMKRPEYVAAAVTACRQALEGQITPDLQADLQNVFSRSGFTDGYFTGQRGKAMFGIRRREDVAAAAPALHRLAKLYEKESPRFSVDAVFTTEQGKPALLTAQANGTAVTVQSETAVQTANSKPLTEETVRAQLAKTGGTQFYMHSVHCEIKDGCSLPVSAINRMRRGALAELEEQTAARRQIPCAPFDFQFSPHHAHSPRIICRFRTESQIPEDLSGVDEILLPMREIRTRFDCAAELPRGIFGGSDAVLRRLDDLKAKGCRTAWAGTVDGIALAKQAGFAVSAGLGTNIFNTPALEQIGLLGAERALLSPELQLRQVRRLGGDLPRGVFAYGRLPLMLTRNCPVRNQKTCEECRGRSVLTDRKQAQFPVDCVSGCAELLNSRPIFLADRLHEIENADFLLLYFTTESREEAARVLEAYRSGAKPQGAFTRGLLYRGVE